MLNATNLKELVEYNQETGDFFGRKGQHPILIVRDRRIAGIKSILGNWLAVPTNKSLGDTRRLGFLEGSICSIG